MAAHLSNQVRRGTLVIPEGLFDNTLLNGDIQAMGTPFQSTLIKGVVVVLTYIHVP